MMFKYKLNQLRLMWKGVAAEAVYPSGAVPVAAPQLSHGVASLLLLHKWSTPLRPAYIPADKKQGGAKEEE